MYYKDRFLSADKAQIILWKLMELTGEESFFNGYRDYLAEHREKPATLEALQVSLENASGMDLDDFFHRWFFTSERLTAKWKPGYDAEDL
jgi:aminopeptidase N